MRPTLGSYDERLASYNINFLIVSQERKERVAPQKPEMTQEEDLLLVQETMVNRVGTGPRASWDPRASCDLGVSWHPGAKWDPD